MVLESIKRSRTF